MRRLDFRRIFQNRKTLYLVLTIMIVSVFSLTVVYAALSVTLNIVGNTEVVASNWDIHLANPKVKSGSVHSNLPTIDGNDLEFNATLTTPGDFYEFYVDVVNDGTIDAMIDSVVKTPELTEEQSKYLKYEVSYQNGISINTKQILKKNTTTSIKVRVEYRTDLEVSDLPTENTNLELKLTLVYVQSDGSNNNTVIGSEEVTTEELYSMLSGNTYLINSMNEINAYATLFIDETNLDEMDETEMIARFNNFDYNFLTHFVVKCNADFTITTYMGFYLRDENIYVNMESENSDVEFGEDTVVTVVYTADGTFTVSMGDDNLRFVPYDLNNVYDLSEAKSFKIMKATGVIWALAIVGIESLEEVSYTQSYINFSPEEATGSLKIVSSEFPSVNLPFETLEYNDVTFDELHNKDFISVPLTIYNMEQRNDETIGDFDHTGLFLLPVFD